jgi:Uma2 family endonuclease
MNAVNLLSPPVHTVQFTYQDLLLFPDDGKRHELIDGDHYVSPSPVTQHQRVSSRLHRVMSSFIHRLSLGELFAAPYDVVLSDGNVVEPDLLYVSAAHSAIIRAENIQGAPDLVVEILSTSSRKRDEIIKQKLYERYGVAEYWIVDPDLEQVRVYRFVEGRYARVAELSLEADAVLASPQFPGLTIPLAEIFG